MKKLLALLILLSVCEAAVCADEIRVAAAADLSYALRDLGAQFQQKTGNAVTLSFGASGNLYSQIQNGAPFDLFFSADADYPKRLAATGQLDLSSLRTYAVGELVLWVPKGSPLNPQELRMELLVQSSVQEIAIANPEHAPYGRAAVAAMEHFGLKDKVARKLVLGENVSQAAQFVASGNAQAALIPLSLAASPAMRGAGKYWQLPAGSYPEMEQVAGIIASSRHKPTARAFLDFVRSPQGAAVLRGYGFKGPAEK